MIFLYAVLVLACGPVFAADLSLDAEIEAMLSLPEHPPFVKEATAKQHPRYATLLELGEALNAEVRWTKSVARAVLKLPFHPDRYRFKKDSEFDGWFDEFTTPNLILIHNQATLVILVHELRHALHLGSHGLVVGNEYDRLLIQAKREIEKYQNGLNQRQDLTVAKRRRMRKLSTRLVETFSEIMAHHGDYRLTVAFDPDAIEAQKKFMRDYRNEFRRAYQELSLDQMTKRQSFMRQLPEGLEQFWAQLF
ncbi:MAG: hypothetical protein AB7K41_14875 [Bdellovibrionales bacterium]